MLPRLLAGDIKPSSSGCFGPGFYLTPSKEKAIAWAKFQAERRGVQAAVVRCNVYLGKCKHYSVSDCNRVGHNVGVVEDVDEYYHPVTDPASALGELGAMAASPECASCPCVQWLREGYDSQYVTVPHAESNEVITMRDGET